MAGQGPAPKVKHSRTRDDFQFTELENTGDWYGPELPEGIDWHPMTRAWWDALRAFPLMADQDEWSWAFMLDTALMHHTMWSKGQWTFAAEIRLRVAKYGATPEDRMRLKLKVVTPGDDAGPARRPTAGKVSDIAARRDRLTA